MQGAGDHTKRPRTIGYPGRRGSLRGHRGIAPRRGKVEDVKYVGHLYPELYGNSFRDGRVLNDREIYRLETRSKKLVATANAEGSDGTIRNRGGSNPYPPVRHKSR